MNSVSTLELKSPRSPACAGTFYPGEASKLRQMVTGFLTNATKVAPRRPKAVIAPHAGYIYSGPIAASAFVSLADNPGFKRVVLLGPSHRLAFPGIALSEAMAFLTPLGKVLVDHASLAEIRSMPCVHFFEPAHAREHSLEVELPFLQRLLGDFLLIPLVVGEAKDREVEEVIQRLWGGPETLIVVSSDLSHYHPYTAAKKVDRATAQAIEELAPEEIEPDQACGYLPIRGLLRSARHRRLNTQTVDLRSSGDTAGPRDRVVGYGAFVFSEN
jgi:AmmeMemoRadiSam system protein B